MTFRKATKKQSRLRMAIDGPAGSGKTFTALRMAHGLGKKIAVINTESGAIEKYLGESPDGVPFDFDIVDMVDFAPTKYTQFIQEAGRLGYDVLIVDSLSHAWSGSGGALELKDRKGGNSFTAWKDITPMHNQMIEAILRSPCHIIATMRTKMEYVLEEEIDSKTGAKKSVPKKVGMAPVQRAGMEYEFDVVADMDQSHTMKVSKSRCSAIDNLISVKPGTEIAVTLKRWLEDGTEAAKETFATSLDQLPSTQQMQAEQQAAAAEAARTEARRRELLQPPPPQIEQPPFVPTPTSAPDRTGLITDAEMTELVELGGKFGFTPEQINAECQKKFGFPVMKLPQEPAQKLLTSFRNAAATAAGKNSPAA